jgi:hypothetical protein
MIEYMVAPQGIKLTAIGGVMKANPRAIFGKEWEAGNAGSDTENSHRVLSSLRFSACAAVKEK